MAQRYAPPGTSQRGGRIVVRPSQGPVLVDPYGAPLRIPKDDPAWQPPRDPLKDAALQARASIIHRQIPLSSIQTTWGVSDVRSALDSQTIGLFDQSGQLMENLFGDDRIQATMGARTGSLLGRPIIHRIPDRFKDSSIAKECRDAWADRFERIAPDEVLSSMCRWGFMHGSWQGQLMWDTSEKIWCPYLDDWHVRFTFYHWLLRQYVAITQDGLAPIVPGDAHWVSYTPYGPYRGWMQGSMRATAYPWLIKSWAYRDWARYSERHGMPIIRAYVPAAGDPLQKAAFINSLANLTQEVVLELPVGVDDAYSYDADILEASDQSWQAFPGLIDRCEMAIVLAMLYQNLTTMVEGGSFAAAQEHSAVKQAAVVAMDNARMRRCIYEQISRAFAAINFGDPDIATITEWDVPPIDDYDKMAGILGKLASALYNLREGGYKVSDVEAMGAEFGLRLSRGKIEHVDPIKVQAGSGGEVDDAA